MIAKQLLIVGLAHWTTGRPRYEPTVESQHKHGDVPAPFEDGSKTTGFVALRRAAPQQMRGPGNSLDFLVVSHGC